MASDVAVKVSAKCSVCRYDEFGVTFTETIVVLTCAKCFDEIVYAAVTDLEDKVRIVRVESWPQSGQTTV